MGYEREPVNCERIIHHSGSCFVWKWQSKRNQNIIMFTKMCLFKNWKLGKIKVILDLEKCQHRLQTSPNNWKRRGGKDMEMGPVPPETDSSPFRIFQWLLQPSTSISCALGSSICWVLNNGKMQVSNLLRYFRPKKETRVMTMIWIFLQFLVERCKTQIFKGVWNDGSASGNHVTLVSGLRSLALASWRSLKIENSHPDASEAADAPQASDCICGQKMFVHGSLSPPLIEELSGTNVLSQAALASAFFPYKCFMVARSNSLTLHSLNTEKKEHRHKFIWRVYLQLGAS